MDMSRIVVVDLRMFLEDITLGVKIMQETQSCEWNNAEKDPVAQVAKKRRPYMAFPNFW